MMCFEAPSLSLSFCPGFHGRQVALYDWSTIQSSAQASGCLNPLFSGHKAPNTTFGSHELLSYLPR